MTMIKRSRTHNVFDLEKNRLVFSAVENKTKMDELNNEEGILTNRQVTQYTTTRTRGLWVIGVLRSLKTTTS